MSALIGTLEAARGESEKKCGSWQRRRNTGKHIRRHESAKSRQSFCFSFDCEADNSFSRLFGFNVVSDHLVYHGHTNAAVHS